jgi:hypothetical protein
MRTIRRIAPLAAALIAVAIAGSASASNTGDYRFEGNFKNSAGPAADLVKFGPGGDFVERRVGNRRQGVWKWPVGTGVKLKHAFKALDHKGKSYTFVVLINLDEVAGYNKLIDFDREEEAGLYSHDGALVPFPLDDSASVMQGGAWYQIAMTRSKGGTVKLYIDGVCPSGQVCLAFNFLLNREDADKTQVLGRKGILTFLRDDEGPMLEQTSGMIARLRIHDDPLSEQRLENLRP